MPRVILVCLLAGAAPAQWSESFDVPDTTTIVGWSEDRGDWVVAGMRLAAEPAAIGQEILLDATAGVTDAIVTSTVHYPAGGPRTLAVGHLHRYAGLGSMILLKVQDNGGAGNYNRVFAYDNLGPMASGFADLATPFTTARFQTEVAGTSVTLRFDQDFDGTWDETFTWPTAITTPGRLGVNAYAGGTLDDWQAAPLGGGCAVPLCGDCDLSGTVDVLDALAAARHAAGLATLTGVPFSSCNVTGILEPDPAAVVDILDALALARVAAGLPVTLVCC